MAAQQHDPEAANAPSVDARVDEPPVDLESKVRFLRSPAAHGMAGEVTAIETHMSWVFLAGDFALKLKKPVRFPFLDFSTVAARAFHCREELRLNHRLAPGVYLGLRALRWTDGRLALGPLTSAPAEDGVADWLVAMRRLPGHRMLDRLVAAGTVGPAEIDGLVELLGRFYRGAVVLPVPGDVYAARFHRQQAANREVLLRPQFDLDRAALALDRLDRALDDHAEILVERCARGRIVDGHGDLRPEHVCLLEPPVVIDALEFNAGLRQVDPFDEIAFLALECELSGAPWIRARLVHGIGAALDEHPRPALIHLYTALRAMLRARLAMAHLLDPLPRTPERWPVLAQRCVGRALSALDDLAGFCPLRGAADAPGR
jgi:aminoglycoside phosphotransferase family enzyme